MHTAGVMPDSESDDSDYDPDKSESEHSEHNNDDENETESEHNEMNKNLNNMNQNATSTFGIILSKIESRQRKCQSSSHCPAANMTADFSLNRYKEVCFGSSGTKL
jgi:hypothetical protein